MTYDDTITADRHRRVSDAIKRRPHQFDRPELWEDFPLAAGGAQVQRVLRDGRRAVDHLVLGADPTLAATDARGGRAGRRAWGPHWTGRMEGGRALMDGRRQEEGFT